MNEETIICRCCLWSGDYNSLNQSISLFSSTNVACPKCNSSDLLMEEEEDFICSSEELDDM